MRKLITLVLLMTALLALPVNASSDPYPDWEWNGVVWVYNGDETPHPPPPPPPPIG